MQEYDGNTLNARRLGIMTTDADTSASASEKREAGDEGTRNYRNRREATSGSRVKPITRKIVKIVKGELWRRGHILAGRDVHLDVERAYA